MPGKREGNGKEKNSYKEKKKIILELFSWLQTTSFPWQAVNSPW